MKKTKVISAILALCILLGCCCGCGAEEGQNADSSPNPQPEASASTPPASQPVTTSDDVNPEPAPTPVAIPLVDKWEVNTVTNEVPITPEGYEGNKVTLVKRYTGKDGVTVDKTYTDVAFLDPNDENKYAYDFTYWTNEFEINGERPFGQIICETEYLYFLEHHQGEEVQRFFLDIDIPGSYYYFSLLGRTEKTALIKTGSYIFVYDFESAECKLITDSALDYDYPVQDTLYFTDWDHCEYQCNWNESTSVSKTGNSVIRYLNYQGITKLDDFQEEFLEMQNMAKTGRVAEDALSDKYSTYSGNIYSVSNDEYMGNLHLPYATERSSKIWRPDGYSCWLIEGNSITRYRYNDVARTHELHEGEWYIIESYVSLKKREDVAFVEYDLDVNNDGIISAEELDERTLSIDTLLMDISTHTVWHLDSDGNLTAVAEDVQDYCEAYGEFYWMNSKFNAYELSWTEKDESVLIGKDVVGISYHTDERAGFVVKPGDPRCNWVSDGFSLCTLYGEEWLNQEESSGAWALEYDWQ